MNLSDVPSRAAILIDANILLYCAQGTSHAAADFMRRCAAEEVRGFITSIVLAEFCHRRMMMEAVAAGLAGSNPARALSQKPALIRSLSTYADDVRDLSDGSLAFEPVVGSDFILALELQQRFGLLTNDSLNLAAARRLSVTRIATADANFDSVADIFIHKPTDVPA